MISSLNNPAVCPMCGMEALVYDSCSTGNEPGDIVTWVVCTHCGWDDRLEEMKINPLSDDEDIPF